MTVPSPWEKGDWGAMGAGATGRKNDNDGPVQWVAAEKGGHEGRLGLSSHSEQDTKTPLPSTPLWLRRLSALGLRPFPLGRGAAKPLKCCSGGAGFESEGVEDRLLRLRA